MANDSAIHHEKEGEAWKLVRIHAAIDPVGNPIIESLQGMTKWIIGGVCALAGLLVGRLLPRKRRG